MKVAVITRHAITNYGSLLQAMATQQVIENLGHTCEIIHYVREDETYEQCEKTLLRRKASWNNNWLKRALYLAIRQPGSIAAGKKFEKEQAEHLNLTQRYSSITELAENTPSADVYMTGSDQAWGPVSDGSYDSSYCLSFTDKKKIAYAASFGHTTMTPELKSYYKRWLSRYAHIAVREDSAVQLLEELEISAEQVLDPTMLLDVGYWNRYLKPIKHNRYVLVYQLHNDKMLGRYAEKVAKAKGVPLIRISASQHQTLRQGTLDWCPDIGTFLSYIKNAECMITDSFHGTAFAINFNTPFVEVLPNNNTGTRNLSILKITGLSDRILHTEDDYGLAEKPINFVNANKILTREREKSLKILKKMIEE